MPTKTKKKEVREEHRAKITQPVRVQSQTHSDEIEVCRTVNVSKSGLYFTTPLHHYYVGLHVHLVLGFRDGDPILKEWVGEVLRVERLEDGRSGIAVHILMR